MQPSALFCKKAAVCLNGGFERLNQKKLLVFLHLGKALGTIDRTVFTRLERNLGFAAAVGADSGEHFPLGPGVVLTGIAAGFAALRLIDKAALGVELLLASGENKLGSALFAC